MVFFSRPKVNICLKVENKTDVTASMKVPSKCNLMVQFNCPSRYRRETLGGKHRHYTLDAFKKKQLCTLYMYPCQLPHAKICTVSVHS